MSVNIAAVMAKQPELSKVKTRLAKTVGDEKALEVYKALLENLEENCTPDNHNSFKLGTFITPVDLIENFQKSYKKFDFYQPQSCGDLGKKMQDAFHTIFSKYNAEHAILVGVDIPDLNRDIIDTAFEELCSHDVVLGPTSDGGYYLIGMHQVHVELFSNINWGSASVFDQTKQICERLSLKTKVLQTLSDLDTEDDLVLFPKIMQKLL